MRLKVMKKALTIFEFIANSPDYVKEEAIRTISKMYEEELVKWEAGSAKFPFKLVKLKIYPTKKTKRMVKDKSIRKKIMETIASDIASGNWDVSIIVVNWSIEHFRDMLVDSLANLYIDRPFTVFQDRVSIDFLSELMAQIVRIAPESRSADVVKELMGFFLAKKRFIFLICSAVGRKLEESKVFRETVIEIATKQIQETPKIVRSLGMVDLLRRLVKLSKDDNTTLFKILPVWIDATLKVKDVNSYNELLDSFFDLNPSITNEMCSLFTECLTSSLSTNVIRYKRFFKRIVDRGKEFNNFMVKRNIDSNVSMKFSEWVQVLSVLLTMCE